MTSQTQKDDNPTPKWYLVQCKPRDGFRAHQHLLNQNFQAFHPTHNVKRRHAGKTRWQTESLFPHYLFVRLHPEQNFAAVNSTCGVSRIVGFNGNPQVVHPGIVSGIMRQVKVLNGQPIDEPEFKPGDTVTITEGCFKHIQAIVKTTQGEERVILLMQLINRPQELTLPSSALQPC